MNRERPRVNNLVRDFRAYHHNFIQEKRKYYLARTTSDKSAKEYLAKKYKISNGDQVIRGIIQTLTNLKHIRLYDYQLDFIKIALPTIFKYIYRNEWMTNKPEILKKHKIEQGKEYDEMFFVSARRMGKTLVVAQLSLALCVNIKKNPLRPFTIAVFASTKDSAKRFISECVIGWKNIDKANNFYFHPTSEFIIMVNKNDMDDIRIIQCFCGRGSVSF